MPHQPATLLHVSLRMPPAERKKSTINEKNTTCSTRLMRRVCEGRAQNDVRVRQGLAILISSDSSNRHYIEQHSLRRVCEGRAQNNVRVRQGLAILISSGSSNWHHIEQYTVNNLRRASGGARDITHQGLLGACNNKLDCQVFN